MAGPPPPLALCYHGVESIPAARDPHRQFVSPDDLQNHIARLRKWGYRFTTFSDLARRVRRGDAGGHVALTFDDGLADNLTALVPILREEDVTATVFVTSGWLDKVHPASGRPILTVSQLKELADDPRIEIGGHTHNHPDLSKMPYERCLDEFRKNKMVLEETIGRPIVVTAYPFGAMSDAARRACRDAGFEAACSTSGEGDWSDPFALPRQDMSSHQTSLGFWLKKKDMYEKVVATLPGRVLRRAIWKSKTWR